MIDVPRGPSLSLGMSRIAADTREAFAGLAVGRVEVLESALGLREAPTHATGLDPRTFGLVKVAALVAIDAPPAAYAWQISDAVGAGATAEDILGVLKAIAPQIGGPRVIAAAPEIMLSLGLTLPDEPE
jgi:4-carboxymuconolactone decarboxylase